MAKLLTNMNDPLSPSCKHSHIQDTTETIYIVDVLMCVSTESANNMTVPRPPPPKDKGEMQVSDKCLLSLRLTSRLKRAKGSPVNVKNNLKVKDNDVPRFLSFSPFFFY